METLINRIYEINGLIESLVVMAEYDERFENPLIPELKSKMKKLIEELEKDMSEKRI